MSGERLQTFEAFWPFYLGEHSLPTTRWVHFIGSTMALVVLGLAVWTMNVWLLPAAVVQGYAWAWVSHFFIEKNRPATFTYPAWSLAADWKMWAFMLSGKLDAELKKHNIVPRRAAASEAPAP